MPSTLAAPTTVTAPVSAPPCRLQVLTSGMWPQTTAATTCNLPRELEQCTTEFAAYYLHANSGGLTAIKAAAGMRCTDGLPPG